MADLQTFFQLLLTISNLAFEPALVSMDNNSSRIRWIKTGIDDPITLSLKDIYVNSNLKSATKFVAEAPILNASPNRQSLIWSNITRAIKKLFDKRTNRKVSTDISTWSESPFEGKASVKERLHESHQKGPDWSFKVRDLSRQVKNLTKVIKDRNVIAEFGRSITSARIG